MELNTKNIFARYYRWIYDRLPDDICSFFWGSVLIISLAPILIPGRCFQHFHSGGVGENFKASVWFYAAIMVMFVVGSAFQKDYEQYFPGMPFWLSSLVAVGTGLLLILAVVLFLTACVFLTYLTFQLGKKLARREADVLLEDKPSSLSIWVGAIKQKYCTKIIWKDHGTNK